MSRIVKIKFVDMPGEFDKENNFIVDLLRTRYEIEFSDQPDFLFYSVFGIEYLGYRDCVRIFMDGEPVLPNFNDCDYAIGYTYLDFGDRYLRVAALLASSVGKEMSRTILDRSAVNERMAYRKFCNFIYSNDFRGDGATLRIDFCKKLMEYKHVDCPGRVLNNMDSNALSKRYEGIDEGGNPIVSGNDWQDSKQAFQAQYKFTIAFENVPIPGMTTEKLINPLFAFSVPIYWGNPEVAREFNPKSFINCSDYDNDFDRIIERVKELDRDDEQYLEMLRQPPLMPDFDFNQRDKLREYLYMIIERGNHPVRNPTSVDFWEPVSANLIVRWGGSYQTVHDALAFASAQEDGTQGAIDGLQELYSSNTWKLASKIQRIADSRWGYIPKRIIQPFIKADNTSAKVSSKMIDTVNIDFSQSGNSRKYTQSGWYDQEERSRWSRESATIRVTISEQKTRVMTVYYRTHPGAKETKVYYNDTYVGVLPHHWADEDGMAAITLPGICANKTGIQIVSFDTEGAMTSRAYYGGDVTDDRVLGVMVSRIVFS